MRTTCRFLAAAVLAIAAASSWALPSLQQVEAAVNAGDYAGAETMTREVVAAKPNAPKAHYILAELMAHNRELSQAKEELNKAKELDPAIHFTALEKFNAFQRELDESIGKAAAARVQSLPQAALGSDDEPMSKAARFGVIVLCFLAIIYAVTWIFRRQDPVPNPIVRQPMTSGLSTVGPAGGYASYPQTVVQPSTGPSVLGTGLAVAGGMVAGELLTDAIRGHTRHESDHSRNDDSVANNAYCTPSSPSEDLAQRPIDFGNGNDWGDGGQTSSALDLGGSGGGGGDDGGWNA
jgi:hypothetical protein